MSVWLTSLLALMTLGWAGSGLLRCGACGIPFSRRQAVMRVVLFESACARCRRDAAS
jgi:hypothetical protein